MCLVISERDEPVDEGSSTERRPGAGESFLIRDLLL